MDRSTPARMIPPLLASLLLAIGAQAASLTRSEAKFVEAAAVDGQAEVELGKMAADKASKDEVKKFGQRMADDHSKAGDELKTLAQKKNITPPTELDAKHKALRDRLTRNYAWLESMAAAWQQLAAGHDPALGRFVAPVSATGLHSVEEVDLEPLRFAPLVRL